MAINDIGPPHQITQIDRSGDKLCLVIDDHKKYLREITRHTFTQKNCIYSSTLWKFFSRNCKFAQPLTVQIFVRFFILLVTSQYEERNSISFFTNVCVSTKDTN
jgi:hypothetical protein